MAYFLNGNFRNNEFELVSKEKFFVDKTKLIKKMNELVGTASQYVCITRPRRFGKTVNAMMLASYYSKKANFRELFDRLEISKSETYLEHLNKHNVIYIDFSKEPDEEDFTYKDYISRYKDLLKEDLIELMPDIKILPRMTLSDIFKKVFNKTKEGFIFIIDEWDYIFNKDLFTEKERKSFLTFLMNLLKGESYVELVYMTGILPVAKYFDGSTLNMFDECTMLIVK